jgi:hypothetical protein
VKSFFVASNILVSQSHSPASFGTIPPHVGSCLLRRLDQLESRQKRWVNYYPNAERRWLYGGIFGHLRFDRWRVAVENTSLLSASAARFESTQ